MNILGKRSDLPFLRKSDHKKENPWFLLRMSRILAAKHKPNTVGRLCAWADHYLEAVICRSSDRLSANRKKEKFASNIDKLIFMWDVIFLFPSSQFWVIRWSSLHCRGFALFVRRQKLLFLSLVVRRPSRWLYFKPTPFIFSFVLCGMSIFVSTVTEVTIGFLLYFNLVCNFTANSHNFTCFLYRWYCSRLDLCFRWQAFLLDYSLTDNNIFCCCVVRFLYINLPQTATTSRTK